VSKDNIFKLIQPGNVEDQLTEILRMGRVPFSNVAVLWNAANPYPAIVFKETQTAGRALGIDVRSLEVRGPDDFDGAFAAARQHRPDALITVEDPLTFTYRKRIADFAVTERLPSLHGIIEDVKAVCPTTVVLCITSGGYRCGSSRNVDPRSAQ